MGSISLNLLEVGRANPKRLWMTKHSPSNYIEPGPGSPHHPLRPVDREPRASALSDHRAPAYVPAFSVAWAQLGLDGLARAKAQRGVT
jgi:hypothetical protein